MPVFELQGPDGATYQIEAPDQDTAVAAFQRIGQPPQQPRADVPRAGLTDLATQGVSFGFADEVGASGAATGAFLRTLQETGSIDQASKAAGEAYNRRLGEIRQGIRDVRAEHPIAATAAEVAGGLATGGTLARGGVTLLNAARPTVPSMVARGAAEGAAYGALHGFGTGEGLEDRTRRAASGAAVGGAAGGAMGLAGGALARRAARRTVPTSQDLRRAADAAYDAADRAGVVVSDQSFSNVVDDIANAARQAGIDRTIHPKATAALSRLQSEVGKQPTLRELDTLRRVLKSAAASSEADERRVAQIMIEKLDDYITGLSPSDVVAGDASAASRALREARRFWSRFRKAEMIDEAVEAAVLRASSTGSGGNADNAIRQNIRAILTNPKRARMFTEEERRLMKRVVEGGRLQNLARWLGKMSPQGNGLALMLHLFSGSATGGATLPLAGVGAAAKAIADRATPRNVNALLDAVRLGQIPAAPQLTGPQQALIEGLLVTGAQQGQGLLNR